MVERETPESEVVRKGGGVLSIHRNDVFYSIHITSHRITSHRITSQVDSTHRNFNEIVRVIHCRFKSIYEQFDVFDSAKQCVKYLQWKVVCLAKAQEKEIEIAFPSFVGTRDS